MADVEVSEEVPPPSPLPRTKWTRRVPHPVLIGQVPLFALARTLHDVVASGGAVMDRVRSPRAEAAEAEEPGEAPREERREAYDADEPLAPVAPPPPPPLVLSGHAPPLTPY